MNNKSKSIRVCFICATAFSATGGIEKFNRAFIKGLSELERSELINATVISVYDKQVNKNYISECKFIGFNNNSIKLIFYLIANVRKFDLIVLGHINLSIIALVFKLVNSSCKLIEIVHGIEVWKKVSIIKRLVLKYSDCILSVSNFTKNQLILNNRLPPEKVKIFPNTIDPFFKYPNDFNKPEYLIERYKLSNKAQIILTISRLANTEMFKGYDKVIEALPQIIERCPNAIYLLAGKYDEIEKNRIDNLIERLGMSGRVIMTGFIDENEIADHYLLADAFIMPSRKEGFGIVFLEAMACGLPVIGGNKDGTVDALKNGILGTLINPSDVNSIEKSLIDILNQIKFKNDLNKRKELSEKVKQYFGFEKYKNNLKSIIEQYQ